MDCFPQLFCIVKGWHLLFTGANGHRTYGITVSDIINDHAHLIKSGLLPVFTVNDNTFRNAGSDYVCQRLGLVKAEYGKLEQELLQLEAQDAKDTSHSKNS